MDDFSRFSLRFLAGFASLILFFLLCAVYLASCGRLEGKTAARRIAAMLDIDPAHLEVISEPKARGESVILQMHGVDSRIDSIISLTHDMRQKTFDIREFISRELQLRDVGIRLADDCDVGEVENREMAFAVYVVSHDNGYLFFYLPMR